MMLSIENDLITGDSHYIGVNLLDNDDANLRLSNNILSQNNNRVMNGKRHREKVSY